YSYLEAHKNSLLDKEQWGEDLSLPLDAREGTHILEKSRKGEGVELPIHACATDLSVLRTALSMEKDFHVFYQNAAEKIQDPEGKKILRELAVWEEGHEEIIQEQLESLREDFMRDMGFEPF
ncbi:MAG TPA: ferritin family protein, partial [Synergistaceae bacterium]|nr:ferritin family protein [Synergistaceae bacterium]